MKFGQLIEYKSEIFILKNHVDNETERLAPDLVLFVKKVLNVVKASGQHLNPNIY